MRISKAGQDEVYGCGEFLMGDGGTSTEVGGDTFKLRENNSSCFIKGAF